MPAGQLSMHGEVPARSMTAFFGTACGNAMYAACLGTRSALNWSGTATVHAIWQSEQPVHAAQSMNGAFSLMVALKVPSFSRRIPLTSL